MSKVFFFVAALLALAACHDLPALGTCGNGIAEQTLGEACDDAGDSATCTATCELRCTTSAVTADYVAVAQASDGTSRYCPGSTYRCGADLICRAPSGQFAAPDPALAFDITGSPVLGDLDGDGNIDLIGTSATSIVVRFGSTSTPLATAIEQQAPSSDAPYAIFDLAGPHADASKPATTIAVPTEGIALLGSDGERFSPELDLPIPVSGETSGLVVRDPDPALGDVVLGIASHGAAGSIAVIRAPIESTPGVPQLALPPCTAPGGAAWHTIATVAAPDRRSFVVVTGRDGTGAQPWHVCRYTQSGLSWTVADLELAAPAPSSIALGNLDGDACLELAIYGTSLAMLDASGADCSFAASPTPLPLVGTAAPVLAAGAIIPGDTDELVLGNGVYRQCTADCSPLGSWLRVVTPTATWTVAALSDLNGDGALDVVAARANDADVDVVRGGAVPNLYRANTNDPVTGLVAGDFDGDRLGDVALVESSGPGDRVSVLFGSRDATVGPAVAMSPVGGSLKLEVVHEVHWLPSTRGSDGIDDLLVLKAGTAAGLLIGDAARIMTTPRFPPNATGQPLGAIAAGAFGSDDTELLAITGTQIQLYNAPANDWAPPVPFGIALRPPVGALRDGTGHARAVAVGPGPRDVMIFGVRGSITMCPLTVGATPRELRAIDLDHDGVDELAVLANDDQGAPVLAIYTSTCPAKQIGADALDGCTDIVNAGRALVAICNIDDHPRGLYVVTPSAGQLVRAAAPFVVTDGDARFVTAGDFDGDGILDLAVGVQHGGAGVAVQRFRQCPAHDTRACE